MKKTLTANISGTVFHIEEDAYDRLHRYLNSIRAQFSGTDGREEIMADIEARIAELFQERLDGRRQVISDQDVEHVIGIMGQPEDYMVGDREGAPNDGGKRQEKAPPGGYTTSSGRSGKRLFRHPDDKWVGGVLGGVATYFNVDPLILRLIYLVSLFLGFGFLLYVILWIMIPKADSAADMLQMRGEPVNVENIKRMFTEGAERFQQGAQNVASEAEELGKRWSDQGSRSWSQGRESTVEPFFRSLVSVAGKVMGAIFLIIGAILTLVLIGGLVGGGTVTYDSLTGMGGTSIMELSSTVFDTASQAFWFVLCAVLLGLIPAVGLFIGGLRLLTGMRAPQWVGWSLSLVWTAALIVVMIIGFRLGHDFSRDQVIHEEVALQQPAGETLFLDVHDMRGSDFSTNLSFDDGRVEWDMDGLVTTQDSIHGAWAELDVVQSADSLFHLYVKRRANGRSEKMAMARASHIHFNYVQQDSLVRFSPWVDMPRADKLRAQYVRYIVHVPMGRAVHFNGGIGLMLDDVKNASNTWDDEMVGRTWTMTPNGLSGAVRPEDVPDDLPVAPKTAEPATSTSITIQASQRTVPSTLPNILHVFAR